MCEGKDKNRNEAVFAANLLMTGHTLDHEYQYSWLSVFDNDELFCFIQEINNVKPNEISQYKVAAIIHEWKATAIAVASPEIAAAFSDEYEGAELPLTPPSKLTEELFLKYRNLVKDVQIDD